MKKIFCLICLLVSSAVYTDSVYAASLGGMDPGAINKDYVREMRTFDAVSRAREKSAIIQKNQTENQTPVSDSKIKSIQFTGNKNFTSDQLLPLVQSKIESPMTSENTADIRKKIMRFYQTQGFYSAIANIVAEDAKTGNIVVEIIEGSKNSIVIE